MTRIVSEDHFCAWESGTVSKVPQFPQRSQLPQGVVQLLLAGLQIKRPFFGRASERRVLWECSLKLPRKDRD